MIKNNFRQGMKLEGIDPQHPSMYFVLTVAEVHCDGSSHLTVMTIINVEKVTLLKCLSLGVWLQITPSF